MTQLRKLTGVVVGLGLLAIFAVLLLPVVSIGFQYWLDGAEPGDRLVALVGIVGALITACTVIVTARIALGRLTHEREENSKNRSLDLKKEVMLEAVRGLGEQVAAVGQLGVVEVPIETSSKRYQEAGGRIAAAYAVASPEVVGSLRACSKAAAQALMELLGERGELQNLYSDMTIASDLQGKTAERTQRFLDEHASAVARGADAREIATLQKFMESSLEQARSLSAERDSAYEALTAARIPFLHKVADKVLICENNLKLAVAAIRMDMGVDISSAAYLEAVAQDPAEIHQIIDHVRELLPSSAAPPPE